MDTAIVIVAVIVGGYIILALGVLLIVGMAVVWPLSLILILLGGFAAGGAGAFIGAGASGLIGLFFYID